MTLVNVLWETTLQRLVAPELLSRVVAYDWLFALAFTPLGFALAGVLAGSVLGVTSTLWLGAAIALALAASVPLIGDVRRLQVEPETAAAEPVVEAS